MKAWLSLLLGIVALLGATVFLLVENNQLQDDVDRLRDDVRSLQRFPDDVRSLQRDMEAADDANVDLSVVDLLRRRVKHVYDCVPELQDQLNTLEVIGGFAYPGTNVSRFCSDFVYGEEF